MDCQRIRDLIITDYIDQEASEAVQNEVRLHLKACAACREFEQAVREKASDPLRRISAVTPPESLWKRVRETIEEEEAARYGPSLLKRLADFLAGAFAVHRPAIAISTAFAVVFVSAALLFPFYRRSAVRTYLLEQSESFGSASFPVNGDLKNGVNFDTAIENAFLGELS